MLLLRGPLNAAGAVDRWGEPPNVWWPEDRAWCVASEIDLMSTYVGGSASCVAALLADEDIEALPVSVDQRVTWDADTINPLPAPPGSGSV